MIFEETSLRGAYIIRPEKRADERGFFARGWCRAEFAAHGLPAEVVQVNLSSNRRAGTLRGMHWQVAPFGETKLVRCTAGAIHDVIVDLREESPTYLRWLGVDLVAGEHTMLFVPERFAHGFLTLADDTEVTYQVTREYTPAAERGARHDDPAFGITWPRPVHVISEKDRAWPDYAPVGADSAVAVRGGR